MKVGFRTASVGQVQDSINEGRGQGSIIEGQVQGSINGAGSGQHQWGRFRAVSLKG